MTDTAPKVLTYETATALRRKYGGITATPVSESKAGIRIGIYGPGGIGKTTLAASIVDSEYGSPALYLDARGNPEVVSSYGDRIEILPIPSFDKVEAIRKDVLRELARGEFPYKSVIIDNLSELHALDLRGRYAGKDIEWTMHSATTADLLQLARDWSDLATIWGIHVVFIAWDTPETRTIRGQEVSRSEMAFNKALQAQLPGIISWLGRLYIVSDSAPWTRCLDFRPIESMHQAKFQVDPKNPLTGQIPMEIYNPNLATILDCVIGGKPFPVDDHKAPGGRFVRRVASSVASSSVESTSSEKKEDV